MIGTFVRGSTVTFSATFTDEAGAPAAPASASVAIRYVDNSGNAATENVAMTGSGATWSAAWNTAPARPGTVYWTITADGTKDVATEGYFTITANPSNPSGYVPTSEAETLKRWLAEAENALHQVMTGGSVARMRHGDREMSFTLQSSSSLRAYIAELKGRLAALGVPGYSSGRGTARRIFF